MQKIERILCAVDFSEMAETVAGHAYAAAKAYGAELVVLYVAPALERYRTFQISDNTLVTFETGVIEGARKTMDAFLPRHFPDVKATGKVILGHAAETIVKTAQAEGCGLIVMGTHGREGLDRILFGSVAERVIKTSPVPVMSIR